MQKYHLTRAFVVILYQKEFKLKSNRILKCEGVRMKQTIRLKEPQTSYEIAKNFSGKENCKIPGLSVCEHNI